MDVGKILLKEELTRQDLVAMLSLSGSDRRLLFEHAAKVREEYIGRKVWFRGLIEFSNICSKDCLYCGIRRSNSKVRRYDLDDEQIVSAARFAYQNNYGSVVLQSGERQDDAFAGRMEKIIRRIKDIGNGKLGITLSLGEQKEHVYRSWFDAGAHRYLLRIEEADQNLYSSIHPDDGRHSHESRISCLRSLKNIGYQVGTGIMIGLPGQTLENLADDLLFMRELDIDMVGMGPYVEHDDTPLAAKAWQSPSQKERFELTLKMIATLRILMKDINIAAATALQAIDPMGREKAVMAGANIVMPNITPGSYRNDYSLYMNKPCVDEEPEECLGCLEARIAMAGYETALGEWGDSKHFSLRGHSVTPNLPSGETVDNGK